MLDVCIHLKFLVLILCKYFSYLILNNWVVQSPLKIYYQIHILLKNEKIQHLLFKDLCNSETGKNGVASVANHSLKCG